jgi:hypothetical protein
VNYERTLVRVAEYLHPCAQSIEVRRRAGDAYFRDQPWIDLDRLIKEKFPW